MANQAIVGLPDDESGINRMCSCFRRRRTSVHRICSQDRGRKTLSWRPLADDSYHGKNTRLRIKRNLFLQTCHPIAPSVLEADVTGSGGWRKSTPSNCIPMLPTGGCLILDEKVRNDKILDCIRILRRA